jgi:hypothetical protein
MSRAHQPLGWRPPVVNDTPLHGDFNGDGIAGTVVIDQSGNILFRGGLPGSTDAFAPPEILNPGRPARAITVIQIGSQLAIVAADTHYDPTLAASDGQFVFRVSLYMIARDGQVTRTVAFSTRYLPTSPATAQLTGNGLFALIAADALDHCPARSTCWPSPMACSMSW